jgi:hypothetical protein
MPALNFNAGVLSLSPSVQTFSDLLNFSVSNPLPPMAEQGVLNNFFPAPNPGPMYPSAYTRVVLPMKYNVNLEARYSHKDQWDDIWADARVVHFTILKPIRDARECKDDPNCMFIQSIGRWFSEYEEMKSKFGWDSLKPWDD